jgi:guanine nucleotide-binding protein G(i) subunit alpha
MKIIHQNGYSQEELALHKVTIYKNLLECAKLLIGAIRQFEVEITDEKVAQYAAYLEEYQIDTDPQNPLDAEVGTAIVALCKDLSYEKVMERQNEFYLMDSAP